MSGAEQSKSFTGCQVACPAMTLRGIEVFSGGTNVFSGLFSGALRMMQTPVCEANTMHGEWQPAPACIKEALQVAGSTAPYTGPLDNRDRVVLGRLGLGVDLLPLVSDVFVAGTDGDITVPSSYEVPGSTGA